MTKYNYTYFPKLADQVLRTMDLDDPNGVDRDAACTLAEAVKEYFLPKPSNQQLLRNPQDAMHYFLSLGYDIKEKEYFAVLLLNARNVPLETKPRLVSIGSLNSNLVHPREVFRHAIQLGAAAVLVMHNHPSEDLSPSKEDLKLTSRLIEAGKIIGIEVLDHVIVSLGGRHLSFRAENYIS